MSVAVRELTELRERVEELESQEQPFKRLPGGLSYDGDYTVTGALGLGGDLRLKGRQAVSDNEDGWLRLNNFSSYVNGVYTPGVLRVNSRGEFGTGGLLRAGVHPSYASYGAIWRGNDDYTLLFNAENTFLNSHGGAIYLRDNNSDRARIDSNGLYVSGRIGVGLAASSNVRLHYTALSNATSHYATYVGDATNANALFYLRGTGAANTINGVIANTGWVYLSDERAKEGIEDEEDGLAKLKRLRPIRFRYKGAAKESRGFSAQQLQEVFPDLVDEMDGGALGVRTTDLIPVLLKGLTDLDAELDRVRKQAKQRIDELEGRLAALEQLLRGK